MRGIRLILCFLPLFISAQPGGGGGLFILNVLDENLKPVEKEKISVKHYFLDSLMNIVSQREIAYNGSIQLAPKKNQGLLFQYKNKEYRVDFENIGDENGAGVVAGIDSLVLFQPYILSKRNYHHPSHDGNEFRKYLLLYDHARKYLNRGITPDTYKKLSELDLMFDSPEYAYNQRPKPWMEDFKNLYYEYWRNNFKHTKDEYQLFLAKIENIIDKYGDLEWFIMLKMRFLYEMGNYEEFLSIYEKNTTKYKQIERYVIEAYRYTKKYNKAIKLSKQKSLKAKEKFEKYTIETDYLEYSFAYFFMKSYHKNKNIKKKLKSFINQVKWNEENGLHITVLQRFQALEQYNFYKFGKRTKKEKEIKNCLEKELLKVLETCIWCDRDIKFDCF